MCGSVVAGCIGRMFRRFAGTWKHVGWIWAGSGGAFVRAMRVRSRAPPSRIPRGCAWLARRARRRRPACHDVRALVRALGRLSRPAASAAQPGDAMLFLGGQAGARDRMRMASWFGFACEPFRVCGRMYVCVCEFGCVCVSV